ncbi:diguanylate cyclase domain-containing protein [Polymorphospora lycopeni]|uniref:GGDEF domain-containing protein n=1 Tax=Polymorphospora lycopeni TaxID=3140240 RepID=A0ABV5CNR1_9ACTN
MSHLHSYLSAAGGILAGLAAAGPLLGWQRRVLRRQRQAIASRERDLTRWRRLAMRNDTSGLPNRRALLAHLDATLTLGEPLGVVLLDLDRFKAVNDVLGHELGNDLLSEVGRRLSALPPPVALAVHLSGDEFALVVHGDGTDTDASARAAYDRIAGQAFDIAGRWVAVSASVGYAVAVPGMGARDVLHAADQAMYLAKRGEGGVCPYTPDRDGDQTPPGRYRDLR